MIIIKLYICHFELVPKTQVLSMIVPSDISEKRARPINNSKPFKTSVDDSAAT